MFKSIQQFLTISSLFLLLTACSTSQTHQERPVIQVKNSYFDSLEIEYVYTARIQAYNNELNGIFVAKKIGENHQRVALLSDFGNTLLDIAFIDGLPTVHYAMEQLNRKIILNKLTDYLYFLIKSNYKASEKLMLELPNKENRTLFIVPLEKKSWATLWLDENSHLFRIDKEKRKKTKLQIDYYGEGQVADSVHFKSFEIPVTIKLYKLN